MFRVNYEIKKLDTGELIKLYARRRTEFGCREIVRLQGVRPDCVVTFFKIKEEKKYVKRHIKKVH
jgi:hypothetical protein